MIKHSLGFIFNSSLDKVLLIHKTHPDWQKGKLNGVGGKVEEREESLACIVREIEEETNLKTKKTEWIYAGKIYDSGWQMDIFGYIYAHDMKDAKSVTEEKVEWLKINKLPPNVLSNLNWIIPLILDKIKNKNIKNFAVENS